MKDLDQTLRKYFKYFLLIFFVVAVILRWWYLPANAISFAYDQARDAYVVQEILNGHLKILGPSVSGIPGLFHGVLYYYIITPAYFFGNGNPAIVAYFMSFISSLCVFTSFYLSFILTKKIVPSLISASILAFSFEASQYANFLVNASMAVWFVPVFYIGLYLWIKRLSKWAPIVAGLALGFSIQSEIALGYHIAPLVLWLSLYKQNIKRPDVVKFIFSFLLSISSLIVSELKFGFTGIKGIYYLLSGQDDIAKSKELSDFIVTYINQLGTTLSHTIFPINTVLGGLMGIVMIIFSFFDQVKNRTKQFLTWQTFLGSYILIHFIALPFGGSNMTHIMTGAVVGISVFAGIFIWKYLWKSKLTAIVILSFILISNTVMILKENKNGQTIFPFQLDLVLSKEIEAVDYTYEKSLNKEFSISTLTSPLYVNTLWAYLYEWHGQGKYGQLPKWRGKDQIGQLGNNLQFSTSNIRDHFFIMEPTYGIPELYVTYAKGEQEAISDLVNHQTFGEIVVQQRHIKDEKKN